MVLGIQIAGFLFGLFMLYYSFLQYKRRQFNGNEFGFWIAVWAAFITVSLFPNLLDPIVKKLNFIRRFDLLVISGFIFIIGLLFYTYAVTRKNQKQIETLVREIALRKKK